MEEFDTVITQSLWPGRNRVTCTEKDHYRTVTLPTTTSSARFSYSFGYDCVLSNNLHVLDATTLIFVTGNLIHFLNVESGMVNFRMSALGLGITCLAVSSNPHPLLMSLFYLNPRAIR